MIRRNSKVADIFKQSGSILGPGKPDSTGPMRNTPECSHAEDFDTNILTSDQLQYMKAAKNLVDSGKAKTVDDIEMALGYGIIDKPMLHDTFFKDTRLHTEDFRLSSIIYYLI